MPFQASRVIEHTRTVTIPFPGEGDDLEITYCPARRNRTLLEEIQQRFQDAQQKALAGESAIFDAVDAAALMIERIAVKWNVVDKDGKPEKIAADFLVATFGYPATQAINRAILDDMDSVGNLNGYKT